MNINFYHNYFLNKKEKYIYRYIIMLSIMLIIIMPLLFIPYTNNKIFNGYVVKQDRKYYGLLKINYNDIQYIKKECLINKQRYKCVINKIEKDENQYLVLLDINLATEYLIDNYPIKVSFEIKKENLYKKMKG